MVSADACSVFSGFGQTHVGKTCLAGDGARALRQLAARSDSTPLATVDDAATPYAAVDRNRTTAPGAEDIRHSFHPLATGAPSVNVDGTVPEDHDCLRGGRPPEQRG